MEQYLKVAVKAVKVAGERLKKNFDEKIVINSSIGKDIKLQSDIDSERIIFDILEKETDISILSEEFGYLQKSAHNQLRWIVDPLDGSLNFSRSIFINSISIGLWNNQQPLLGVIYDFIHDDLFTGIIGGNALLNENPITTSLINNRNSGILCTGFPVYSDFSTKALETFVKEIQSFKKVRLLGSAAISLTMVAKGAVEAYKEDNIAIWDVAAGIPIVIAAGGKCEIKEGKSENLLNVFAYNGKIK
jgi:fructose-1,6-bisphosphatase/inositol monophosphatase family enzyme